MRFLEGFSGFDFTDFIEANEELDNDERFSLSAYAV